MKFIVYLILVFSQPALAKESELYRIGFWNILMDLAVDKWTKNDIPLWHWRKKDFLLKLDEVNPDIIGFAEALPWQANYIQNHLKNYNRVGYGAYTDAVLFYNKKFKEINRGWFFLSNRPYQAYSIDYGHVLPRLAIWVELKTCGECESFIVLTTHLDGLKEARQKMLKVIDTEIKKIAKGKAIVLIGDLNISFQDKGYRIIESLKWYNTYALNYKATEKQEKTYRGRQVDHIMFLNKHIFEVKSWKMIVAKKNNTNLSDHHMVFSDIIYKPKPKNISADFSKEAK